MRAAISRRAAQLAKLAIKSNSEDFQVFCRFMGHVNEISVEVHIGGWKPGFELGEGQGWVRSAYLDKDDSQERIEGIISELEELKKSNGG